MSDILLVEQATPTTPGAGERLVYPKSDGSMYQLGSDGTEYPLLSTLQLPLRLNSTTETLTAAAMGKLIVSSLACTKTLPLLADVKDGEVIGFHLNNAVAVTVSRQGTDEMSWNGYASLNSVLLTHYGDYLFLIADKGSSRWRVLSEHIQGPYFKARYTGGAVALTIGVLTKLPFNTEQLDSHSGYDPTTNYRFTPPIPGWYQVFCSAYFSGSAGNRQAVLIYKNGTEYSYGSRCYTLNDGVQTISIPVYFNGLTDYVEAYGIILDAASGSFDDPIVPIFSAVRIR